MFCVQSTYRCKDCDSVFTVLSELQKHVESSGHRNYEVTETEA